MVIYYLHIHSDIVTHNHILAASLKSNKSGEEDCNYFPELTESARSVKDTSRARLRFFKPFMGSLRFCIQARGQTQHQLVGSQDS